MNFVIPFSELNENLLFVVEKRHSEIHAVLLLGYILCTNTGQSESKIKVAYNSKNVCNWKKEKRIRKKKTNLSHRQCHSTSFHRLKLIQIEPVCFHLNRHDSFKLFHKRKIVTINHIFSMFLSWKLTLLILFCIHRKSLPISMFISFTRFVHTQSIREYI